MNNIMVAVILDLIIGDPYSFPHPVKLMGRIIDFEDTYIRRFINSRRGLKISGLIITITNILLAFSIPYYLLRFLEDYRRIYSVINIYLMYTCISAKSLHSEAMKVYEALNIGIKESRKRLSYIVGRDTSRLSEEEIIKATVETVSENTSDGIIAPLIFIFFLGAPGGLAYKMVNTMDSMLGYMNDKYIDFGYFPAKIDDIFNYIPARVTGVLMCLGSLFGFDVKNGFKIMIRDRKNHKSPNAIYPEAAAAGLLNIQLGGNSIYHGKIVEKPNIGDKIKRITKEDIKRTIELMYRTEFLLMVIYFVSQKI